MAKNGNTNGTIASQTFTTFKDCKHVVRFNAEGKADVDGKTMDELSSSIYVDKQVLGLLGNPDKIVVTVAAAK